MSWSPQLCIGEFRPWPESIHVTRDKIDETRRYVPEKYSSAMQCLASIENVKLRELVRDVVLLASCDGVNVTNMQMHVKGGDWRTIADRMRELGIEVDV